ncbi:Serine/threonine-protein kinase [Podosphaera aphanis]|nr:Serine/threonine-protein kinase [Podosphaera aphanis]
MSSSQDDQNDSDTGNQTPRSGVATPHPDIVDKRLPGINHSYFGQVGLGSSIHPNLGLHEKPLDFEYAQRNDSFHSRVKVSSGEVPPPSLASDSILELESTWETKPTYADEKSCPKIAHPYPTPPVSHTNSLRNHRCDVSSEEESITSNAHSAQLLSSKCPSARRDNFSESLPSNVRKASTAPLSSILTALHISALMSNPSDRSKYSSPGIPSHSCLSSELQFPSIDQLKRLTESSSKKPFSVTPTRALSDHTDRSDASVDSTSSIQKSRLDSVIDSKTDAQSLQSPIASAPAPVVKGRLVVKIAEARGLRKSRDPYVVAVFQRNELVSKGPIPDDEDGDDDVSISPAIARFPFSRSGSDSGRAMAIPMKSRQSSNTSSSDLRDVKKGRKLMTHPQWDTKAVFDVVGSDSRVVITVYDRGSVSEEFIGIADLQANITERDSSPIRGWFPLRGRNDSNSGFLGEIYVEITFQRTEKKHYGPEDFDILKLIGKGTFGQVYQVRKKDTRRIYAMKVLQKKVIVQKKEVAHTVGERNILVRTAMADSPFIVGLKFSFQTPTDLYLVTDYMSGGELFWHLQKEGRFDEKRAKFYIAELILALQHLHKHDIVYRDLKPENILLDANGHIALCDFGLSKANLTKNATTNTFCGTTEYLAPEVLLDEAGYTKMVDFWSLGVLVFEMCCGWSPFYAEDTQQMYKNIAFGKVRFPRDTLTTEGRNFVKGLLNRNPKHRLGAIDDAEELKQHPFFADIKWDLLTAKKITPPFKPKLNSETDTSNFDPEFTNALNDAGSLNARAAALAAGAATSTPLSPGMQANFKGFTFVDESSMDEYMEGRFQRDDWEIKDEDFPNDKGAFIGRFNRDKREDRMSGIVQGGEFGFEDSAMINGSQIEI